MCKNGCGNTAESDSEYCGQHCTNPNLHTCKRCGNEFDRTKGMCGECYKDMKPKKNALDVTTKGWKKEDIDKLRQKVQEQGLRYQVEIKLKDGNTKFLYVKKTDDVKAYCEQMSATIVKIEDFK